MESGWCERTVEPNHRHKNRERTQRKGVNIHLDTGFSRMLFLTLSIPDRDQPHHSISADKSRNERTEQEI